ncbi:MAG: DUF6526 family protein [Chitinophagaceae bacterium]|nr:DUF6526 family protein [Chitinophagaceae bacterium]
MEEQNFKNHARMVPGFHYLGLSLILGLLGESIYYLIRTSSENKFLGFLLVLISIILVILWIYIRIFPLKAQDRAIRAEENLRFYVLTGKLLPSTLTIAQTIALRFAPDEELVELVDRVVNENLSAKDIKLSIKNWKADYHRV